MEYIDSHSHYWKYDPKRHTWIGPSMGILRRDFLPGDLQSELSKNIIDGSIAVQADNSETETEFLLDLARENSFIKGVVGWVDLTAGDLTKRLDHFNNDKLLKGIGHMDHSQDSIEMLLSPSFEKGFAHVRNYGLIFDMNVSQTALSTALRLAVKYDDQPLVIADMGRPAIVKGEIQNWRKHMLALGQLDNVFCKLSGMVTLADWEAWDYDDFTPYLDVVIESFGAERLIYGSGWPVCLLAAKYERTKSVIDLFLSELSESEQDRIMGQNAIALYKL